MSDAGVRRQETKFNDVTAIGQSAEGIVAARGDEDDLHGAIRRYDFEFRLDRMLGHGISPSRLYRSPITPAFQPRTAAAAIAGSAANSSKIGRNRAARSATAFRSP